MKVRNQAKLVRLAAERQQYIRIKNKLSWGRTRAAIGQRPGGMRALRRPGLEIGGYDA